MGLTVQWKIEWLNVLKPRPKLSLWKILADADNPTNQSELEETVAGAKHGKRVRASHNWFYFTVLIG